MGILEKKMEAPIKGLGTQDDYYLDGSVFQLPTKPTKPCVPGHATWSAC